MSNQANVKRSGRRDKVLPGGERPLAGKVAVVAGATRGAGRGIARALGEAGAIVYCTGRSTRSQRSPYNRPETIEETADLVTAAGGKGIALRVDHTIEDDVRALFEKINRNHGRLDVLADSVAGEDPLLGGWTSLVETDLSRADAALRQALVSHLFTAKYAAKVMKAKRRGLIVEVTEGDMQNGGGNALQDLVKSSLKWLVFRLGWELRKDRVAAVAVTPGFLRSERMLDHFGVTEANWREGGKKDKNFLESESPLFIGRGVAALAADPKVLERTGEITSSWELARHYGLTDADGRRPDWGRHAKEHVIPAYKWLRDGYEFHAGWLERLAGRARHYLGVDEPAVAR
jgi:NAD(P)-dependent dehydrogenase (short-subunit alcohol dehydrogenase family)